MFYSLAARKSKQNSPQHITQSPTAIVAAQRTMERGFAKVPPQSKVGYLFLTV